MGNKVSREGPPPAAIPNTSSPPQESECPVPERYRNQAVYNVYNQRINDPSSNAAASAGKVVVEGLDILDPKNNMPLEPNQQPCPGQKKLISTDRVVSNIPKGGTEATWVYPSPQMFYNGTFFNSQIFSQIFTVNSTSKNSSFLFTALKRKGKGDDVTEDDMDAVVHAHNSMNEITWQEVRTWELLHREQCGQPTLLRFLGRPDDLSPLARIRSWFGGTLPFDRHDWYVDRCGKEVRYVIDFYFDEAKAGSPDAFEIVVRPALDSPEAALDRVKMNIYQKFHEYGLPCPVTWQQGSVGAAAAAMQRKQ